MAKRREIASTLQELPPEDELNVFGAPPGRSFLDYLRRQPGGAPQNSPAPSVSSGYEGMPAPQAEGMPTHDPDGTVSRIANALATLPTVQAIKDQVMLPRQILAGEKGVPQSFGPTTPDAQTDEAIGFGIGNAIRPGAAMSIAKMPLAPGEAVLGSGPIRAYHGSPHDFDKFDLSKIGTGEGAQAYGHGLYFAENEGVARNYRDQLSSGMGTGTKGVLIDGQLVSDGPAQAAAQAVLNHGGVDQALKLGSWSDEGKSLIESLRGKDIRLDPRDGHGRMYEVAIHADPERFLDWDKVQHSGPAAESLSRIGLDPKEFQTGSGVYNRVATDTGLPHDMGFGPTPTTKAEVRASELLRDAGIPGIKYLDQGSRNVASLKQQLAQVTDQPPPPGMTWADRTKQLRDQIAEAEASSTRNYVLFDDKIVEILRKYGVGSIAALPPSVQMAIQLHQDQTQAEPQEPTFAGKASKMINDLQRKLRGPEPPPTPHGMGIRG